MHHRIERDPTQQSSRGIAKPIGRPRMRALVNGQPEQQHDEHDQNAREVDVGQGAYRLSLACEKRKDGIRDFRAHGGREFLS